MTSARSARKRALVVGSVVAAGLVSISPLAGAHGGGTDKVHACVVTSSGNLRIVGPNASCRNGETPLDWSLDSGTVIGPGTITGDKLASGTVTGEGDNIVDGRPSGNLALQTVGTENLVDGAVDATKLSATFLGELLTETEFLNWLSIMRADEPTGPKGPNDLDGFLHWNHLEGIPDNVLSAGDGRITGDFIQDGTITSQDLEDGTIRSADLAGADADPANPFRQVVVGAVTSEKIADGTIHARDLGDGAVTVPKLGSDVINRFLALESRVTNLGSVPAGADNDRVSTQRLTGQTNATVVLDPGSIPATTRTSHSIPVTGLQPGDLVTVSPPAGLDDDLLFVGYDVDPQGGGVIVYMYNNTGAPIDDVANTWKIQYLDLTP